MALMPPYEGFPMSRRSAAPVAFLWFSLLLGATAGAAEVGRQPAAGEWSLLGRTADQHHYSPLSTINDANVKQLGLAWYADLPTMDGLLANPLVFDGLVFEIGAYAHVWALDVRTGKIVWSYDPKVKVAGAFPSMWSHHLNRGVALLDGRVYFGTSDCRLIALDAKSGKLMWEVQACDSDGNRAINGAPRVGAGKVFIGNSDVDTGIGRGSMDAFDAKTGRHLWRFYTIPGDPSRPENRSTANEIAAKTWVGERWWEKAGGGSTWEGITYDPVLNRVYFGVDGPSPWNAKDRRGDNLFTDSVVAVDADTGAYLWHYQTVPNDSWDFNDCSPIVIADLPIAGKTRRVLLHAPKNGFFYVLDAKTGALLSADKIGEITWASRIDLASGRPVENPAARYYATSGQTALVNPGPVGVHNWHAMSYDESTHLIYIPITNVAVRYSMLSQAGLLGGDTVTDYYAGMSDPKVQHRMGALLAWDPLAKSARWKADLALGTNGGVLSTAGNLVFQGTATGDFVGYRASDGKKLWSESTGSAIQGAPSTVEIDGQQLLLVSIGNGGGIGLSVPRYSVSEQSLGPARLLAFKLGGSVQLPATVPAEPFAQPPLPPPAAEIAARGELLFSTYACDYCHGPKAERLGMSVPDLRRASKSTYDAMAGIVIGGVRATSGMPAFHDMPASDLEAIRAFVLAAAWKVYDSQQRGIHRRASVTGTP
jgi:PQQ-dependent dehydrogenase (methanol/ethanol family)